MRRASGNLLFLQERKRSLRLRELVHGWCRWVHGNGPKLREGDFLIFRFRFAHVTYTQGCLWGVNYPLTVICTILNILNTVYHDAYS
jgi:hypothetical protein